MSPTLYTARNNEKENNGGNTTMVTRTTMINNGIRCRALQSAFPSFCLMGRRDGDMEGVGFRRRWFTGDVVGHTRHCMDRMCPESWGRDILLQKWVSRSVPLHPPPLQGSDILALLMISSKKGYCQSLQIGCDKGLRDVSDESLRCTPVHECHLLVPRSYVQFHILPT